MSSNNSSSGNSNRNGFIFPDFSLRRLLLQTRTGRAPYTTRMCDVERGASSSNNGMSSNGIASITNNKHEKSGHGSGVSSAGDMSSNKVSWYFLLHSYFNYHAIFLCLNFSCFFFLFSIFVKTK